MLVAAPVIEQGAMLHHIFDGGKCDMNGRIFSCRFYAALHRQFQGIERGTRVAIGKNGDLLHSILVDADSKLSKATFFIVQRAS